MEKPISLEELKNLRLPIKNVNEEHQKNLSPLDKFALWITNRVGTIGFFIIIFIWTVSWLSWNSLFAPQDLRFDPFPGFVLWLFISNMIQIFLMPLIMIGQNLQDRQNKIRADANFEVDMRSAKEVEVILQHLEYIEEMLKK